MGSLAYGLKSLAKRNGLVRLYLKKKSQKGLESEGAAKRAIEKFCTTDAEKAEAEKRIPDMRSEAKLHQVSCEEYFLFRFAEKTEEERREFIPDAEHYEVVRKLNRPKNQVIFDSKAKAAETFKEFYCREVCVVYGKRDFDKLRDFITRHERFIVKPVANGQGRGIKIVSSGEKDLEQKLLKNYCKNGLSSGFIAEELIEEVEELRRFHPSSVNTIRVPAIRTDDGVVIFHPFLRTGSNGSVIDNASAGGVYGIIDPDTGVITSVGDKKGHFYTAHPDTGIQMVGYQIPRWEEAKEFVRKLTQVVPSNRYTGWDIALTEKGWVMVEGNAGGQFGFQILRQQGCRSELRSIFEKIGIAF